MADDPIVAEGWTQRARLLETAGGTVDALVRFLRQQETSAGRVAVSPARPSRSSPNTRISFIANSFPARPTDFPHSPHGPRVQHARVAR